MQISPYLNFAGTCAEAFAAYETIFGGKITFSQNHGETPMKDMVSEGWQNKVMHATIQIGDQVIMGSDAPPERYNAPQGFFVSYGTTDVAGSERIYAALADGGVEVMPLQATFWAERFGMVIDKYGIPWMINCEKPA
jgi:PhnB protein